MSFCLISTQRRGFGKVWGQRFPPSNSSSKLFPGGNQDRQSGAWVHRGEMFLWGGQGDFCPPTTAGQFQDTNKSIENATTLGTKFYYWSQGSDIRMDGAGDSWKTEFDGFYFIYICFVNYYWIWVLCLLRRTSGGHTQVLSLSFDISNIINTLQIK